MKLRALLLATALGVSACSGSSNDAPSTSDGPTALNPGGLAAGTVEIDGTEIDYITIVPEGFEAGDAAPVMFALPAGRQDMEITQQVATGVYQSEAVRRGWVVVSPVAPNGTLYFDGSEVFISGLLDWVDTWVGVEGKPHLVGVSNGGLSAFRALGQQPDRFDSILVFPGFPRTDADRTNLEQAEVPIRMFVGETDAGWVEPMQETYDTLSSQGRDITLEVFPGEGHRVVSLSDGVRIFDELDELRESN